GRGIVADLPNAEGRSSEGGRACWQGCGGVLREANLCVSGCYSIASPGVCHLAASSRQARTVGPRAQRVLASGAQKDNERVTGPRILRSCFALFVFQRQIRSAWPVVRCRGFRNEKRASKSVSRGDPSTAALW